MIDLVIRENIACGIRRPRSTDGRDVWGDFEVFKIDAVFKIMRAFFFDQRSDGTKKVAAHPLIRVADVFWDEREEDFPAAAIGHFSGE